MLHQRRQPNLRIVNHGDARVDDFREVVRRNVGRHADRDTRGTIDQQIRDARGHHRRFHQRIVVVRDEIDRLAIDIGKQLARQARHAHFGVTHGRWRVAIDRAKVALTVDKQVAHRERLRHANNGVVHRDVAVRVVLTDDVTDDACRFLVGLVVLVAELTHRVEHATMDRFQAVTNVRECASDDHAHRVIEVRLPHLVFEIDGQNFAGNFAHKECEIVP